MDAHIHTARQQLTDLAQLSAKTEAAERKILSSALARLKIVHDELSDTRRWTMPVTPGEQESRSQAYQALIEERGVLHQVIAQARAALGS